MMRSWCVILVLLLCAAPVYSQRVTLPLGGYFRPGQYMPVRVDGLYATGVRIEAAAAMPVEIGSLEGHAIVPLLVYGPGLSDLRAVEGDRVIRCDQPLRALLPSQRLVATTVDQLPPSLYDDAQVVRVELDGDDPLPGPGLAWTQLDALVVDVPVYKRIADDTIDQLICSGAIVAVRGDQAPDGRPWEARGGWQILAGLRVGPMASELVESAYLPTYGWSPGWPGEVRRLVALIGVGGGVLAVGGVMLGRRRGWLVAVLVGGAVVVSAVALRLRYKPVFEMRGHVLVEDPSLPRLDGWSYQKSLRGGEFAYLVREPTWPIWASRSHREAVPMVLRVGSNGAPQALVYTLPPGGSVALLSRRLVADGRQVSSLPPDRQPSAPRLDAMIQRVYRGARLAQPTERGVARVTVPVK